MEQINIYTSRKKSFRMSILTLLMLALCISVVLGDFRDEHRSIWFIRTIGIVGVLFFGSCLFVGIRQIIRNRLFLTIDDRGLCLDPRLRPSERVEWKHIEGFSEITICGQKIIVIHVNNPEYWIKRETSTVRRKMMRFNINYCGSPFNIAAGATQLNHSQLWGILIDSHRKFKAETRKVYAEQGRQSGAPATETN